LRDTSIVHVWCGIEGVMPDEIPVIGLSAVHPGLVHAFGFSGHGFELGPFIGSIVAQLAADGKTNWPIAAFAPDRAVEHPSGGALLQPAG
ncbi:MAG: FAD-binding oxidoreductase, partial [Acidisphaera sp.]|nr:FAD-binding oxidoreductase [Acidisphaera sp.]